MNSFYEFLAEKIKDDMKKYGIKQKDLDAGIKSVSKDKKVDPKYLKLFAIDDSMDKLMLYFNIEDPKHINYKSTVTYKV
jgi:hypothetical protein